MRCGPKAWRRISSPPRIACSPWCLGLLVAVGLEAIARRINDERRVVGLRVVGADAWLAVVFTAGAHGRLVEGVDRLARLRLEAEMQARALVRFHRMIGLAEPELDALARAVAGIAVAGRQAL